MSNINRYTISNKIRTILLTTIDKEIFNISKKNHLLINSQNHEQITKKFENYRNFAVECIESFEGEHNNENNNIFLDIKCNYPDDKLNFFCHSSKTDNRCSFAENYIIKSIPPEKNNANSSTKKIKILKNPENNSLKLKKDSGKKLIPELEASFSLKSAENFKNSLSLNNDKNLNYRKKFSANFYAYSVNNKNNDSLKLINYCYKLKKPDDEIIKEIPDDGTSVNKKSEKNFLFTYRIKNNYKKINKKRLKKTIKKNIGNKNNHRNKDHPLISASKNNTINFTNQMKLFFDNLEKLYLKDKIKIPYTDKKLLNIEFKETNAFKNIFQFCHYKSKSPEKKLKAKKIEKEGNSFFIQEINNKTTYKKLHHFKSIDTNHTKLKTKQKKEKIGKKDVSIFVHIVSNTQFTKKLIKNSKSFVKKI